MVLLYVLLVAYVLAINFYSFLLIKSLRDKDLLDESDTQENSTTPKPSPNKKLCIAGLLGGAITIYVCMFIFKYKRSDMLLMVLLPLLAVLNIYIWILLFRSGFTFFIFR